MFRNVNLILWPALAVTALITLGPPAVRADDPKPEPKLGVLDSAGLFGHTRDNPIPEANKLIQRMKEDTGKSFVIETFDKPDWKPAPGDLEKELKAQGRKQYTDKELVGFKELEGKIARAATPYDALGRGGANFANRQVYVQAWASKRARELGVDGIYLLILKEPQLAGVALGPGMDPRLFPVDKQEWLEKKMRPVSGNKHYDDDLLSVAIPGVWYTVQLNQTKPSDDSDSNWSWKPTLITIGGFLAFWVAIAAVRGIVVLFSRGRPGGPDPSRTRLGSNTTLTASPDKPRSEDSVDY